MNKNTKSVSNGSSHLLRAKAIFCLATVLFDQNLAKVFTKAIFCLASVLFGQNLAKVF